MMINLAFFFLTLCRVLLHAHLVKSQYLFIYLKKKKDKDYVTSYNFFKRKLILFLG